MKKILGLILFFLTLQAVWAQTSLIDTASVSIPYQKFTLDNGLTLIVHEDHKAPIVAVNLWYHVGSKNEKPGKSGFAHLFEHLMFNGSENFNHDYFELLERIGATDLNGTTDPDRTNYFQNVPVAALDQVLWLESDRMGHLLGVIDQAKLDEQRGVVQNEKRQGENQPYGREYEMAMKASFPAGHPYSWTVIGSMEDLNAASLEDVKEWFRTYYGAANAVLVVAGAVKADDVLAKVKKYFGNISSGPALERHEVNIAKRQEETRQTYEDRVTEPRISMYWNVPQWGTRESVYLEFASAMLTQGKNSRLYRKLVYEDQLASSVSSYNAAGEIAGLFNIKVNVKPGGDVAKMEQIVNGLVNNFIQNGPTEEELKRVKSAYFASFIDETERIGGFGGKSDILAESQVYGGAPDYYKKFLKWAAEATIQDVRSAVKTWLSSGKHVIVCRPFPQYATTGEEADRTKLPPLGNQPESSFPSLETATLKNGLKVILARRPNVPTVAMDLLIDAGYAADQYAVPGTATLTMNLIDEGTKDLSALEISDQLQMLGSKISSFSDLDISYIRMDALKPSLDASLDIYADIILNPAFAQNEFQRLKQDQVNAIRRERTQPLQMALRVFPKYLYGEGHAYSQPLTGSGYEETVSKISREDVVKFYDTWVKPNNSTLVVVGDIEMKSLLDKLEKRFGKWKKAEVPSKNIATVAVNKSNKLYLMDRPESQQSIIIAGYLTEPYGKVSEIAQDALMSTLGGDFTSRLNMNLREDKHWAYGAFGFVMDAKGQRPLLAYAPVQTDKTKEAVQEIVKEFKDITTTRPVTKDEFERTRTNTLMQLPGQWETVNAVRSSVGEIVKYNLPDNYYQTYNEKVKGMKIEEVRELAKKMIKPSNISWVVVGDKEKILKSLKEAGFDEIILVDSEGNPLQPVGSQVKSE